MTNTAQVLAVAADLARQASQYGDGSWLSIIHFIVGCIGALSTPLVIQEATEIIIAVFKVPFYIKPFIPKVLSAAVSGIAAWAGVDPVTAAASAPALMALVSWVNESKWGLELEEPFKAARASMLMQVPPATDKPDAPEAPLPILEVESKPGALETVIYADGSSATSSGPLPLVSPDGSPATHKFSGAPLAMTTPVAQVSPVSTASAKIGMILLAMLLGGSLMADTVALGQPESKAVPSVTGWLAGPSTFISGAEYQMQSDASLTPTAETAVGGQYGFYLGSFGQSTTGTIQFDPLAYLAFGVGVATGIGEIRPVGMVSLGYRDFGISASWNVGSGQALPLVGIQATIPFMSLIPGLDWDINKTVANKFPGAAW